MALQRQFSQCASTFLYDRDPEKNIIGNNTYKINEIIMDSGLP